MATKRKHNVRILGVILLFLGIVLLLSLVPRDKQEDFSWRMGGERARAASLNEVPLCENMVCERRYSYWRTSYVLVSAYAKGEDQNQDQLNRAVAQHGHEIQEEIRSVVASADYSHLRDPHLTTISRRITSGVEEIIGKGLMSKLLIPVWHITS